MRAYARMAADGGSRSADDVIVQRMLRKMSKARAHRAAQHVRNKHGQPILPPEAIRRVKFEVLDTDTGAFRTVKRYRIGYYQGGSGTLHVHDGRRAAADIERLLVAVSPNRTSWTPDRISGLDRIVGRDLDGTVTVDKILAGALT